MKTNLEIIAPSLQINMDAVLAIKQHHAITLSCLDMGESGPGGEEWEGRNRCRHQHREVIFACEDHLANWIMSTFCPVI